MSRTPERAAPAGAAQEPDIGLLLREPERLTLVAQPIVDLRRGIVVGYEALSRFRLDHPCGPDRVFTAAARVGAAEELEARVIEPGFSLAESLPDNCFLTLNVDPGLLTSERILSILRAQRWRGWCSS